MRMTLVRFAAGSAVLATSIALAPIASAQSAPTMTPQVVTTGTGEVQLSPDRATVLVGVQSRAATVALATADNARRQRAIIDTLRALGLGSDQITTVNYNVS